MSASAAQAARVAADDAAAMAAEMRTRAEWAAGDGSQDDQGAADRAAHAQEHAARAEEHARAAARAEKEGAHAKAREHQEAAEAHQGALITETDEDRDEDDPGQGEGGWACEAANEATDTANGEGGAE